MISHQYKKDQIHWSNSHLIMHPEWQGLFYIKHQCKGEQNLEHTEYLKPRLLYLHCVTVLANRFHLNHCYKPYKLKHSTPFHSSTLGKPKRQDTKNWWNPCSDTNSLATASGLQYTPVKLCQQRLWKNRKQDRNKQARLSIAHIGTSYLQNCHNEYQPRACFTNRNWLIMDTMEQ